MKWRDFWRTPRTMNDFIKDRSVTFLELFYDLTFVVYIATINHMLLHHFDLDSFIHFVLLFGIGWWAWFNGSTYHELHGNDDVRSRFFTFVQMFFLIGLIILAPNAFEGGYVGFSIMYILLNLVIAYLWFKTGVVDPNHRSMSIPYTLFILLSVLIFVVSIFFEENVRFILWSTAVFFSLVMPMILGFVMRAFNLQRNYELVISHSMSERMGLFVIIVVGEIIVGVVNGFGHIETITVEYVMLGGFGFLIAVFIWWNYFDFISLKIPKDNNSNRLLWATLHFPLAVSISVIGTLITLLYETYEHIVESQIVLGHLELFVGVTLVLLGLIAFNLEEDHVNPRSHLLSNRVVLALGILLMLLSLIQSSVFISVISILIGVSGTVFFAATYLLNKE